ncbi:unknown [Bacteroides sp. CAG:1076]|nr:unknown [Bacteroides sp. CAG:1076]
MDAGIHSLHQEIFIEQMFDFQCQITENHGQGETFQIASTGMEFVPFTLWIVYLRQYDVESLLGNISIFLLAGS